MVQICVLVAPWAYFADGAQKYSKTMFWRLPGPTFRPGLRNAQKTLCSTNPVFNKPYVQQTLCSTNPMFNKPYVQQTLCSTHPMFNKPYVQQTLCSTNLMFNKPYVQQTLCSTNPMFNKPYVQQTLCSTNPALHKPYVQQTLCSTRLTWPLTPFCIFAERRERGKHSRESIEDNKSVRLKRKV
jgi:hypothetical protein